MRTTISGFFGGTLDGGVFGRNLSIRSSRLSDGFIGGKKDLNFNRALRGSKQLMSKNSDNKGHINFLMTVGLKGNTLLRIVGKTKKGVGVSNTGGFRSRGIGNDMKSLGRRKNDTKLLLDES
ncbi:MAG: hypothetical protein AB7J40_05505 [Candidatus Altimarinota bacterium]